MSDDKKPSTAPPPMPPMTEQDLYVMMRMFVGLTIMGAVEVRVHPCRFPLFFDAMLRYGGIADPEALKGINDFSEVSIPIVAQNPITNESLQCAVVQWTPCSTPDCEGCKAIAEQASRYPVAPEDRPQIWTPS